MFYIVRNHSGEFMPPAFDKELEEKILKAAQRLLRAGGTDGLTLRAIAAEARTTTPTVYKRFRSKEHLNRALAYRIRDHLNRTLFACSTLEDACRQYLRYAADHPNEYKLMWALWVEIFDRKHDRRPGLVWAMSKFAERFGGQPDDYDVAARALFLLCHATASLLTVPGDADLHQDMRDHCLAACDAILRQEALVPSSALVRS